MSKDGAKLLKAAEKAYNKLVEAAAKEKDLLRPSELLLEAASELWNTLDDEALSE